MKPKTSRQARADIKRMMKTVDEMLWVRTHDAGDVLGGSAKSDLAAAREALIKVYRALENAHGRAVRT